jgi:hypothetical protein
MEQSQPKHAVEAWLEKNGHDHEWLAAELKREHDLDYTAVYLNQVIGIGYYPPGRKLQNALHAITGVSLAKIIGYPYRAERAAG